MKCSNTVYKSKLFEIQSFKSPDLMDIGEIPMWELQYENRTQEGDATITTENGDIRMDGMQAISLKYTFHTI